MIREIRSWQTGKVLWIGKAETVKNAIHLAIASGADLRSADLGGAQMSARIETGETWHEYLTEVVPAFLTAGGKTLESCAEHFNCHDWTNCPTAHAFSTHDLSGVPMLLRPRAEQFIRYFDCGLITWPLPVRETNV